MLLSVFGGTFGLVFVPHWGALGGHLGALVAFKWHSKILKLFLWGPWSPQCAPQAALDRSQQRSRRPHREAEGPKKPPRPSFRYRRLSAPDDVGAKSTKKNSRGHRQGISEATWGLSNSMICHSFLLLMFCFCFFFCFSFFSSALSVSFTIIIILRPRRGLKLELRLRLRMRLGLGL